MRLAVDLDGLNDPRAWDAGLHLARHAGADAHLDNNDFVGYNAAASELSWERTTEWLAEHLPIPSA